jgi:hypothetical protein
VPVTRHLPHRSRRAAFPHRAPVVGQTRPGFGAWTALAPPARRPAASVTCRIRLRVRSTRRCWPSPRSAAFPPHPPPPTWSALFGASLVLCSRPTPPAFRGGFALLSFPPRPGTAAATAGGRRSPRFRRDPFVRDLVSDPGRATMPRIMAPLMLRWALWTASAPATKLLSWLNTDPTRLLCTLRRGRRLPRRNTRYQAGATPYLGRTCTGWIAPASPGAPKCELSSRSKTFVDTFNQFP